MNELHLFAGIGGGVLAGELLGHTPIGAVEINPYCRRVLLRHYPNLPIHDDIKTFKQRSGPASGSVCLQDTQGEKQVNTNDYDKIHHIVRYAKLGVWPSKSKGNLPYTEMATDHLRSVIAECERDGYYQPAIDAMKAELAMREAPPLKFNSAKDIAPRNAEAWAHNIEDAIRRSIVGGFCSATVEPPKGLHARIIKGLEAVGYEVTCSFEHLIIRWSRP